MKETLMPKYKSLSTTAGIESVVEQYHIGQPEYRTDSTLYHACRIHDALLVAKKTGEPFASFVERVGCFNEVTPYDNEARKMSKEEQSRLFINDAERMTTRVIALALAKQMLPPESQPTQAESDSFLSKSIIVPKSKYDLRGIQEVTENFESVVEFFSEPEMQEFAEPFTPIVEAMNSAAEMFSPYAQEAATLTQKIAQNEAAHKAAMERETDALVASFGVSHAPTETLDSTQTAN